MHIIYISVRSIVHFFLNNLPGGTNLYILLNLVNTSDLFTVINEKDPALFRINLEGGSMQALKKLYLYRCILILSM